MFNVFKFGKSKPATEADFDVIKDLVIYDVTLTKDELVRLFMQWTQTPKAMSLNALGALIVNHCDGFKARFASSILAEKTTFGAVFSEELIKQLKAAKLIEAGRKKDRAAYKISKRGEQIRQFYVLKKGLNGSIYDRMGKFTAA